VCYLARSLSLAVEGFVKDAARTKAPAEETVKILFDVREASRNITGIGTYVRNLAREILACQDPEVVCRCIPDTTVPPPGKGVPSVSQQMINFIRNVAWKQAYLPAMAYREKADLLVCMDPLGPLACPTPTALIIYDLIFFTSGAQSDAWTRYWRAMVPRCARRADLIFTLSQASKAEITGRLGIPPEKVVVFHTGVADHFHPLAGDDTEREKVRRGLGLPESYILTVGAHDPRRNVKALLAAYHGLRSKTGEERKLVVVGPKTAYFQEVLQTTRSLGLEEDVFFFDYVPNEELPAYYSLAELYVYPSSEEGFGLTPLEAMACGCPVITSRTSSLPEVVGEAALLVNPTDAGELEEAMGRLLSDPELRRSLIQRGAKRAEECSWRAGAEDIVRACVRRVERKTTARSN
jgi:glycosyltransferase involved in cell wall biosynthesis